MANYNKVMLMGNLTRDPQLSYTPNQSAVVDFGLAINRKWKGQDGTMHEDTCFVDCTAFGRSAENINKYLSKGNGVFVEGRLTFDSWTAQDGTKRSKLKVTVETFQFLPRGGQGQGGGDDQGGGGEQGGGADYGESSRSQSQSRSTSGSGQGGDDDIPF
jgi:single-strand DNA-binding protein